MFAFFSRFKKIILITVLVLVPIFLVFVQKRSPDTKDTFSGLLINTAAFFQEGLVSLSGKVSDKYYYYFNALDNYEELLELRLLNSKILSQQANLEEIQLENKALREAAQLIKKYKSESLISFPGH